MPFSFRQRPGAAATSPSVRRLGAFGGWLATIALAIACSGLEGPSGFEERCSAGEVRACGLTLSRTDTTLQCYSGVQYCEGQTWGACTDGTVTTQKAPPLAAGYETLSISVARTCIGNPCDPYCLQHDEEPSDPLVAPPSSSQSIYDWVVGNLSTFPGGLVKKGLEEPCETGADCQFNTKCTQPSNGACSHSVCQEGVALSDDCNECVTMVCAADSSCCDPAAASTSSCEHDPCEAGDPLRLGCDSCVDQICADPSDPVLGHCCDTAGSWDQTCIDAVATTCGLSCGCDTGETLENGSCYFHDSNSRKLDSARASCQARGPRWDLVEIDDATENAFLADYGSTNERWIGNFTSSTYTNFASGEPDRSDAGAIMQSDGTWGAEKGTKSNESICEGPPTKIQGSTTPVYEWTADCVALADSVCDVECDPDDPSLSGGLCEPWYPGEIDASCPKPDLAGGVPCDGVIPICNHGTVAVENEDIRVIHFPANSQQYPLCAPDETHPQMEECIVKDVTIQPGECISVDDCADQLGGNREIMINPGNLIDECSCLDNWTLYSDGTCGEPECGGGGTATYQVFRPVDIVVVVDNSSDMGAEIQQVEDTLYSGLAAPLDAAGVDYRIVLVSRFGDVATPVGESNHPMCIGFPLGSNACTSPFESLRQNPPRFYHYSADIESEDALCVLLGSFDQPDEFGDTPRSGWTTAASAGWAQWLRPQSMKSFIVFSNDDVDCSDYGYDLDDGQTESGGAKVAAAFDAEILNLSSAHFGTSTDRRYVVHSVVGLAEQATASDPWLPGDGIQTTRCGGSSRGPGTGYQALSTLTGGHRYPICDTANYETILGSIADEAILSSHDSCDFALPSASSYDLSNVTVAYTTSADVHVSLSEVTGSSACAADSWYFDDPSNPTRITLCPSSCTAVHADPGTEVFLQLGCPRVAETATFSEVYEQQCQDGHLPKWTFLAYDSTIPGDATIDLAVRTADTQAGLASKTFVPVTQVTSANAICTMFPNGNCPIDLHALLGNLDARRDFLELQITLNPNSLGVSPSFNDWEIRYSCPPGE